MHVREDEAISVNWKDIELPNPEYAIFFKDKLSRTIKGFKC